MDNTNQLFREKEKLNHYDRAAEFKEKENEMFSYKELNTRYINLEKTYDKNEYAQHEKTRQANKKAIESRWHSRTDTEAKKLKEKKGDRTKPEYYESFDMKNLEVLLKNSNRGGNSELFNDVVTDLELLNKIGEKITREEAVALSIRLEESCSKYLTIRKSPLSTEGKIRKAIITQVKQKLSITQKSIKRKSEETMVELNRGTKEEKILSMGEATKANVDLMTQFLQGNIALTEKEIKHLDDRMSLIISLMKSENEYQVDQNQNKDLVTRFFNALGWTERTPKITDNIKTSIENETRKGPRPEVKMFTTINTFGNLVDAVPLARQLMGIEEKYNRMYMSNGYMGKGTYLAASKNDDEREARNNSWAYGADKGAVQLTLALNEKTRLAKQSVLVELKKELEAKFPQFMKYLDNVQNYGRSGDPSLSIVAALFGYNAALSTQEASDFSCEYFVAFDRSILSIDNTYKVALESEANEDDYEKYQEITLESKDIHKNEKEIK